MDRNTLINNLLIHVNLWNEQDLEAMSYECLVSLWVSHLQEHIHLNHCEACKYDAKVRQHDCDMFDMARKGEL